MDDATRRALTALAVELDERAEQARKGISLNGTQQPESALPFMRGIALGMVEASIRIWHLLHQH